MRISEIIENLSLEDLVGQTLCLDIFDNDDPKEVENKVKKLKPGAIFITHMTAEKIKFYTDMVNGYAKVPVIVASDIENGPETGIKDAGYLPFPMAWGACNDPELIEKAGEETARICRNNGIHWTFSPDVDLNLNFRCSESSIRCVSDSPEQVTKIAGAYLKGLIKNNLMAASCKHFPGEGMDERNSHFVTAVNSLSKRKWTASYGRVYKEMIKLGTPSVMIGHISLPAFQKERDELGCFPATVSKSLITDLLRNKLKFDGVIVSDAMSMVGASARIPYNELAVKFLKAGGDVVLFPDDGDFDCIISAVNNGELSADRLKDSVTRIIKMKEKIGLFNPTVNLTENDNQSDRLRIIATKIAEKSIKTVRNYDGVLPCRLNEGDKVLFLNMFEPPFHKAPTGAEFAALKKEFENRGIGVDELYNAKHKEVEKIVNNYKLVLINCKMSSTDYHGGTLRVGWNHIMTMWRGYVFKNKNVVFVSYGDPYKLYDFPYVRTYVNAFSYTDESQRAVVRSILGEIRAEGKNPVDFKPFFVREV